MSNEIAIYDLINAIQETARDVCDGLHEATGRRGAHVLDRALSTCFVPATKDGQRVENGYVAKKVVTIELVGGKSVRIEENDELLVGDGIVSIMSTHYGNVIDIVMAHVAGVSFHNGIYSSSSHLW